MFLIKSLLLAFAFVDNFVACTSGQETSDYHDLARLRAWMQEMKNNSSHSRTRLDFSKFKGFEKLFVLESKQQRRANTRRNRYRQHFRH